MTRAHWKSHRRVPDTLAERWTATLHGRLLEITRAADSDAYRGRVGVPGDGWHDVDGSTRIERVMRACESYALECAA